MIDLEKNKGCYIGTMSTKVSGIGLNLAETVFHMIKSKFGDVVRSKKEIAQINEVLLKVLCHNLTVIISEIYELGIEPNFFVAKV